MVKDGAGVIDLASVPHSTGRRCLLVDEIGIHDPFAMALSILIANVLRFS